MIGQLKGKWALVTGASSGIGKEFCVQLAKNHTNLVMVARREDILVDFAKSLSSKHRIETVVEATDLTTAAAGAQIKRRLEKLGIQINLLVNNAGAGAWGNFSDSILEKDEEILRLNNGAIVSLCNAFFPDLSTGRPSAVINVSSQAAFQPVPYMAVYAASKAFVHSFSQALHGEWGDRGIEVQTLVPGPTRSEFDGKAGAYESAVVKRDEPLVAVTASLKALGTNKAVVYSVKGTYKQRLFAAIAPPNFVIKTVAKMFRPPAAG